MYWILIIFFTGTGGAAVHHVDFFDEKACVLAAKEIQSPNVKSVCVPAQR